MGWYRYGMALLAAAATAVWLGMVPARAAPFYSVSINQPTVPPGGSSPSGPSPVSATGSSNPNLDDPVNGHFITQTNAASAAAGTGAGGSSGALTVETSVTASASQTVPGNTNNSSSGAASASSNETLDDFIITCVSPSCAGATGPLSVSLNLQIVSALTMSNGGTSGGGPPAFGAGSNFATATVVFSSGTTQSGTFQQCANQTCIGALPAGSYSTGLLSGYAPGTAPGDFDFTTAAFSEPIDTPFSLYLELDSTASSSVSAFDFSASASSFADTVFDPTVCYATGGRAFNLPAGYTINSTEAGIVNNVGTATGCSLSSAIIPEPGSLLLLASALLGLAGTAPLLRRR